MFGLEAQGDWADLSNPRVSLFDPLFSTRTKTDGIGLFTGQIGYAWNAALLYVKGGAAVTSNRYSILTTLTGVELASASSTRWGGTIGVGFEYGFAPNWSFGIEYDHCSWAMPIIRSRSSIRSSPLRQQPDQPGRRHAHLAHQLPLRRLRRANSGPLLILSPGKLSPGTSAGAFSMRRFSLEAWVTRQQQGCGWCASWAIPASVGLPHRRSTSNVMRNTSKITAVDQPNNRTPFIAVMGPSRCQRRPASRRHSQASRSLQRRNRR